MSLYNTLINKISIGVYQALNEMSRVALNKTIDKNLWATVSSACSRNRSTEAEFIKPIGNDKNLLIARYVAALLIMKKPCPTNVDDIESLKTFKLVAKKALELGASISDIKNLYDENKPGSAPVKNDQNTEQLEDISSEPASAEIDSSNNSDISFGNDDDDDMFDFALTDTLDITDEINKSFAGLPKNTDMRYIWTKLYGSAKPPILKYVKPTKTEYSYFSNVTRNIYTVISQLERLNWKIYSIPNCPVVSTVMTKWNSYYLYVNHIQDAINDLKKGLHKSNLAIRNCTNALTKWKHDIDEFKSRIDNEFIKNLMESDETIIEAAISPDGGLYFVVRNMCLRYDQLNEDSFSYSTLPVEMSIKFTGNEDYYEILNNTEDIEKTIKENEFKRKRDNHIKEFIDRLLWKANRDPFYKWYELESLKIIETNDTILCVVYADIHSNDILEFIKGISKDITENKKINRRIDKYRYEYASVFTLKDELSNTQYNAYDLNIYSSISEQSIYADTLVNTYAIKKDTGWNLLFIFKPECADVLKNKFHITLPCIRNKKQNKKQNKNEKLFRTTNI